MVFVEFWQHECCGDLFGVGDLVSWPVRPMTLGSLVDLLGDDADRPVRWEVDRHGDESAHMAGIVREISAIFCRLETVTTDRDGLHLRPQPGSGVLRRIYRSQRHEVFTDLEWRGYLVDMSDQQEPTAPSSR